MRNIVYIKRAGKVLFKTLDGETALVTKDDWKCFLLNSTGAYIWRLCSGKNSLDDIVKTVSGRYGLKGSSHIKSLKNFILNLRKKGLLE